VQDIHRPVPRYAEQIGLPVDRLLERLTADRVLVRANWGLTDGSALYDPEFRSLLPPSYEQLADRIWLRIERQTLRRLERTGAVVFTIRTLHAPIAVLRADPEAAGLLAEAMAELPRDVADYKLGSADVRALVLRWLREDASGS
jgi:hypothetical protein